MSGIGSHEEDDRPVSIEAGHMERHFGYGNTYEEYKVPPFLEVKRYSPPILPGNEGFKAQSIGSGGGIPSVMLPQSIHIGSNRKTFLCNSKIITNLTEEKTW